MMKKFLFLIFYFKSLLVCCSGQLWTISASTAWKGLLWHLILGVSSVGREQKQPVFLRGFLCPESLKIMLTVKLKSALSGAPRVPPNRAAQGCQRYYTALLKPAVRWKYCPGVQAFVAVKKKDTTIRSYYRTSCTAQWKGKIQYGTLWTKKS